MAELHDALILAARQRTQRRGFRVVDKSPMPTYRPDLFALKGGDRQSHEEIVVEVEIECTLYNEHSLHQLIKIRDYVRYQKKRRVRVTGVLCVPNKKAVIESAGMLLDSLDASHEIEVWGLNQPH